MAGALAEPVDGAVFLFQGSKNAYASMRPFGRTLTYSLRNARIREDDYATWDEEDYCSPPLAEERAAALDEFFDELNITPVQS